MTNRQVFTFHAGRKRRRKVLRGHHDLAKVLDPDQRSTRVILIREHDASAHLAYGIPVALLWLIVNTNQIYGHAFKEGHRLARILRDAHEAVTQDLLEGVLVICWKSARVLVVCRRGQVVVCICHYGK